ncbi:hypothetical protein RHRU231_210095 [Rhodococcus ruber]|uniref:Transposase for insertion sequence element IS21-like C-terminal domain-containing protein n=1 Tax=Rhodococcus ruber TaxID=1830 RepID=A0A098BEM6_9NOCA|nr:hypothetical protein RHRU231_210095 [Rhodococcus ruber]
MIEHLPGEETQWDFRRAAGPTRVVGLGEGGESAGRLVGAFGPLARGARPGDAPAAPDRRSRPRRPQARRPDPHLAVRSDGHGLSPRQREGHPDSGKVTASFAGVAKHYGVAVAICPPRSGNRKGVVGKANHTAVQRWWRTLPDDAAVEQAQVSVDRFCSLRADSRMRATADGKASVLTVAVREPLTPVPASPYPVVLREPRTVSRQALVPYRGNRYSVPPELAAAQVPVTPGPRRRGHRHRHRLADHRRPAPPRSGRGRGRGPRSRPRRRPRTGRDGRWPAAPPQGTHPARTRRSRRGGSIAQQQHRPSLRTCL